MQEDGSGLVLHGTLPAGLDSGSAALVLQPRFPRRSSRPRLFAPARTRRRLGNHLAEFVDAVATIAFLIAKALRLDQKIPVRRDPVALQGVEPSFDFLWQGPVSGQSPAQDGFRRHLVNVLPARATGAHETPFQLMVGN